MTVYRVIIRGRIERKEFGEPYRQCTDMLENIGAECCVNPADISGSADFVLFFQSYPHEFSQAELNRLRTESPDAPFFFVLGVCCEGMLRTAGPLDSPFYRYVHAWNGEATGQVCLLLQGTDGRQQTADGSGGKVCRRADRHPCEGRGLEEKVYRLDSRLRGNDEEKSLILTHFGPFGNDSAMNRLIADEQRRLGFVPEFCCRLPSAVCHFPILADADDSPREKILETIQRLRSQCADNDFTVYVDSPRIDEKNDYIKAGITRICPKMR